MRQAADDRRLGPVPGRAGAGEKRHRPGSVAAKSSAAPRCTPQISGTIDYREPNDEACLERVCGGWSAACRPIRRSPPRRSSRQPAADPPGPATDLYDLVEPDPRDEYEVRDVLRLPRRCATASTNTRPSTARRSSAARPGIGGFPVGIVANQHHRVQPADGPIQFGGVLYVDSAEKAARFVMNCNQDWLPILFLQDVNGFMVGRDSERAGIIKAGAKLVNAISNSRVPKLTVILGGSFGAGNYALCGKAFDPRFIFAWPTARYAVMGGDQATSTLLDITVTSLKRQGHDRRRRRARADFASKSRPTTSGRPTSATPPPAAGSTRSSIPPRPATC